MRFLNLNFSCCDEKLQYCRFSKISFIIRTLNVFSQIVTILKANTIIQNLSSQIFYLRPGLWNFDTFHLLKSRRIVNFYRIFLLFQFSSQVKDSNSESCWIKQNFVRSLISQIDFGSNGIPFGDISIGKV